MSVTVVDTPTCIGAHGRIVPLRDIAYVKPLESNPDEGSIMHLIDGSVIKFAEFPVQNFVEIFGFIYLPKDRLAFCFTTSEFMRDASNDDYDRPTTILFKTPLGPMMRILNPNPPTLMLDVKTSAREIQEIIDATEPMEIPVYEFKSNGEIEAKMVLLDFAEFKTRANDQQASRPRSLPKHQTRRLPRPKK